MNLVVCIPGNNFSEIFLGSILAFQRACFNKGINVVFSTGYSPNLYIVRNMVVGGSGTGGTNQKPWQGKANYDYILWVDSDIIFNFADFENLLNSNKQIISGLYYLHNEKREYFAAIKKWDEDFFLKNGTFQWLSNNDVLDGQLFKVDHIGMGFMLMKAGVLENLPYPWFRPKMADLHTNMEICTEDVSFCHLMIEKGFSIWVNPKVIVKHEKRILL